MNARKRLATLLLAWLVIIPIGVLVPSQAADAAPEEDVALATLAATPDVDFGTRISGGQAAAAHVAAAGLFSTSSPMLGGGTLGWLDRPEFSIWPNENLNQVINLDSFMSITSGYRGKSRCLIWFFGCKLRATTIPVGARFEFRELGTGGRDTEDCWGPGIPWFWGQTDASGPFHCGQEWHHSSDVTGQVEVRARVLQWLFLNGIGPFPVKSPASDAKTLDVGEVLNIGQSIALPVVDIPEATSESGFCSVWGVSFVCWIGEEAAELALDALYLVMPFLEEVAAFFEGCADAVLDAAGGLVNIIRELGDLITNPGEFVSEKLQEFKDLIEAIREDPEAFVTEALADILELDKLKEEGGANWVGTLVCKLAIEYFTGKAADTIIGAARTWLRDRRDRPDTDRPDNDDPDNPVPPCQRTSSFPGDTEVLMADGTYRRIDAIRPGDTVVSHNVDTSVWEPASVLDQWSHLDRGPPATATLVDGGTVTATDDHLFWRPATTEWVELQYVQAGDELLTPNGHVTVATVDVGEARDWTVWELDVTPNHNFLVAAGDHDLLVHNIDCPPDGYSGRTLDELLPDGRIPTGADYADWWNDLTPEELDWLMQDTNYANTIKSQIREGGLHEWCMCSRVQRFKEWGLTMEQIREFTTSTSDVRGTRTPRFDPDGNPYGDWAGEPWAHPAPGVPNSAASAAFHRELGRLIDQSPSMDAFRDALPGLLDRWGMDPSALPEFPDP